MQLFSALLEINENLNPNRFIELAIEWNKRSRHSENIISNINWKGEHDIRYGDDRVWMQIEECHDPHIISIRYEKNDSDGTVWDTSYITNFDKKKICIRLEKNYAPDATTDNPYFSTPFFIAMLIDGGYLEDDLDLPIGSTPLYVDESNTELITDIINEKVSYRLPIIYISKTEDNKNLLDDKSLAERFKGLAHVLVEKDFSLNQKINNLAESDYEINGDVCIYFPNHSIRKRIYRYRDFTRREHVLSELISKSVLNYGNSQIVGREYSWYAVHSLKLSENFNESMEDVRLQASVIAEQKADELIQSFDEELAFLKEQNATLQEENDRLLKQIEDINEKYGSIDGSPLVFTVHEKEFFDGEIKDMVLDTLEKSKSNIADNSRRMDIINDIVETNQTKNLIEKRAEAIKELMGHYEGMTPKVKKKLKDIGFKISDDGRHYKLVYFEDGRYTFSISKTPSTKTVGKSIVQEINRECF